MKIVQFLNDTADQLIDAGFVVEEVDSNHELLDVWSSDQSKGYIEIYAYGFHLNSGYFTWSIGEKEFDCYVDEGSCIDLIKCLNETFDFAVKKS